MQFVKVRHDDGREADITAEEIASYGEMGFEPVDKEAVKAAKADRKESKGHDRPMSAANGTDQRLDAILDELRGLRKDLATANEPQPAAVSGETVELRGAGEAAHDAVPMPFTEPTTTTTTTTPKPTATTTTTAAPAPKR
jgi:hypothetical protein